eukprot:8997499-Heterocapsa_arctica.AAC.1
MGGQHTTHMKIEDKDRSYDIVNGRHNDLIQFSNIAISRRYWTEDDRNITSGKDTNRETSNSDCCL